MKLDREALPCPFCGGSPYMMPAVADSSDPYVACGGGTGKNACTAAGPSGETEAEAIAAWNRRAALPQSQDIRALVEELRAGLEGVTPGPWQLDGYDEDSGAGIYFDATGYPIIVADCRGEQDRAKRNAAHIANCSPENIAKLLDALSCLAGEGWSEYVPQVMSFEDSGVSELLLTDEMHIYGEVAKVFVVRDVEKRICGFQWFTADIPNAGLKRADLPAPSVEEKLP